MTNLNRDTIIAAVLLVVWAAFLAASFDIRETTYETMGSEVWPRIILGGLTLLTLAYLMQSLRGPATPAAPGSNIRGWFSRYRNALWCYGLFAIFLLALPWLGMLIGGVLFVFALLCAIGRRDARSLALHAALALGSVGIMWSIFTFGIGVILPEGELFTVW